MSSIVSLGYLPPPLPKLHELHIVVKIQIRYREGSFSPSHFSSFFTPWVFLSSQAEPEGAGEADPRRAGFRAGMAGDEGTAGGGREGGTGGAG